MLNQVDQQQGLIFDYNLDGNEDIFVTNGYSYYCYASQRRIFQNMLFHPEADEIAKTETYDEESLHMRQLLKTKLIDMDLSVRALNCLKAAEVDTLGDLVSFNKNDLMKFRNFGKKSLTELEELVMHKDLSFGMDLSKYKLEKE